MSTLGTHDPKFAGVADVLTRSLDAGEDLGATVAVIVEGETLVDMAGGFQDKMKTIPYDTRTLSCVYSSGKAVVAALVMEAVSQGRLSYAQPVAEIWPEFAAAGKDAITVPS